MSSVRHRRGFRLIGWLLAAVLVAAGGLTATSANAADAGSISGVVTDSTGAAASDIQVAGFRYTSAIGQWTAVTSATTSADGSYALAGLADGDYRIRFGTNVGSTDLVQEWWDDAPDLWSATTITVSGGTAVADISPVLAAGASISGVVTDEQGTGVRGVSVRASDPVTGASAGVTLTDQSGAYRMTGLAAGARIVQFVPLADSGAVAGEWWDNATSRSSATVITLAAGGEQTGIDAVLSSSGSIAGTVTDTAGAPAPFTLVTVYRATPDGAGDYVDSRMIDSNGAYTIPGVPPGDYKVLFSTSGRLLGEWFDNAADAATATVVTVVGGATATVDAQLTIGATITGVAADGAGKPVGNVTVWAYKLTGGVRGPGMGASTAADGSYSTAGLAPGSYKIEFRTENATAEVAGEWWDDAKTEQSATIVDLEAGEVTADISPRLGSGAGISGKVVDGSGAPLSNVKVSVRDVPGDRELPEVWTGADGTFAIRGLDAGTYRVGFTEYRSDGSTLSEWWNNAVDAASADDIVVSAGQRVNGIDPTLSEDDGSVLETFSASLSGTVTDGSGAPIAGAAVSVMGPTYGDGVQTGADGTWSLGGLRAGPHTVQFSAMVDGKLITQWWSGAADEASATRIILSNAEQRSGVDAVGRCDSARPGLVGSQDHGSGSRRREADRPPTRVDEGNPLLLPVVR